MVDVVYEPLAVPYWTCVFAGSSVIQEITAEVSLMEPAETEETVGAVVSPVVN